MENLTKREQEFILKFLGANECGATNSEELQDDNFSCQTMDDLIELFDDLNQHEISGFLSSLERKGVLWIDERDGTRCLSENKMKRMQFEPDLYWVSDEFLEKNQDLSW